MFPDNSALWLRFASGSSDNAKSRRKEPCLRETAARAERWTCCSSEEGVVAPMFAVTDWYGDIHAALPQPFSSIVLVLSSLVAGTLIGLEREHRAKPAGVKTLSLICVGSTIFTIASILIAGDAAGDRGRIAAQVVTGIGFLGAGAIIRDRGTIVGLTTGATIWVVAAVGVLIGVGYAVGGLSLTLLVVAVLVIFRRSEDYLKRRTERSEAPSSEDKGGQT